MEKKKVLLIDVGDLLYFRLFAKTAKKKFDTTIVTKYYSSDPDARQFFYKFSGKMPDGKIRSIVRGIEYILGYIRVIGLAKKNKYDIIHIQWAVVPRIDGFFWKKLKRYTPKLVYTAHDVIPHNFGVNYEIERVIKKYSKLYCVPDRIIVHGEFCKEEIKAYFPECNKKIYVQKHGTYEKRKRVIEKEILNKHLKLIDRINDDTIVIGCIGQISNYKGIDLLVDAWENVTYKNVQLLVVGKTVNEYKETFKSIKQKIDEKDNIYLYNNWFSEEEEVFFYDLCDIIILPYKSASMSGVIFSAAQYNKTVLATTEGCIKEYLTGTEKYTYTCKPTKKSITESINKIMAIENVKQKLAEDGTKFSDYIYENYSWDKILDDLERNCYTK